MVVAVGAGPASVTWDQISGKPDNATLGDLPEASGTATAPVAALALLGAFTRFNLTQAGSQPLPAALPGRRLRVGSDGGAALSLAAASGDVIGSGSAATIPGPLIRCFLELRCTTTGRWRVTGGYLEPDTLDARYGLITDGGQCRRVQRTAQNLAAANNNIQFTHTLNSTAHVEVTSATVLTLLTTGLWALDAANLYNASAGGSTIWIGSPDFNTRYAQTYVNYPANSYPALSLSVALVLPAGTQLALGTYSTGSSIASAPAYDLVHLSATLLRRS